MATTLSKPDEQCNTASLTPADLAMFAAISVSAETLALAGIRRVTDAQARDLGVTVAGDCTGICFDYPAGGFRVRRDFPDIVGAREENKYVTAPGGRRHAYYTPGDEQLSDDSSVPILVVEAEKSVLAIHDWSLRNQRKVLAMAIGGCNGYNTTVGIKITPAGKRVPEKGLLPEIGAWCIAGRNVGILFDSDTATNDRVEKARNAFRAKLSALGAKVVLLNLPQPRDKKLGPDDFIGSEGDEDFAAVLEGRYGADRPAPELLSQGRHDVGNAQRLIALHGENLRHCPPMKSWLVWDGRRWSIDKLNEVRKLAQETIANFSQQAIAANDTDSAKYAVRSLNAPKISGLLKETEPHLAIDPEQLDADPWLMNFKNGTLNLKTFQFRQHRREDFISKLVPYDFMPTSKAPTFEKFLKRILRQELHEFLKRALGYSVTGVTTEKKAFLALGPTDSGKTTLLNAVRTIFGEYAVLVQIDCLLQRDEDNNSRADLADLRGCRFAMTSETEEGQRLREAKLKRLTQGQGRIKSVRKYENPIEFAETHKLWIDANHRPVIRGTDDAIWNRLVPIPFDQPLKKEEIDRELPSKLLAEAQGIIAWILAGSAMWARDGLGNPPEQIESAKASWRAEMDRITAWRKECCDEGPELQSQARPLYQSYRRWAEETGERPMTEAMFGRRLTEGGIRKETSARVTYFGIALRDMFSGGKNDQ